MALQSLTGFDASSQRVVSVADPSSSSDAATKAYVDNLLNGLRWKQPVRVATTTNGTLASAFANGSSVDGVTLVTGDRILLKNQTAGQENGIRIVAASGAPARATDADSAAELYGAAVQVLEGTANADKAFTQTVDTITLDTTPLVWTQFGGGQTYTADGNGIEVSGNQFALELDGSTLQKSASGVRIGSAAAGAGLTEAAGVLAVGQGTGITVATDTVAVDTSVVTRHASASIGNGSATSIAVTHNLGTKDVSVTMRRNSDDARVETDWVATDTNNVTLSFVTAPTSNEFRVTVHG
ncbi:hypothetical protein [Streptomyces sp. N35]|uniref:hypothetical protein n=1 Tax=Streptomyces sp. N35 TaxID=2795730 RepID=UPI0018F415AB|nr:hypothetical protein [Streptomyces sp. N35]